MADLSLVWKLLSAGELSAGPEPGTLGSRGRPCPTEATEPLRPWLENGVHSSTTLTSQSRLRLWKERPRGSARVRFQPRLHAWRGTGPWGHRHGTGSSPGLWFPQGGGAGLPQAGFAHWRERSREAAGHTASSPFPYSPGKTSVTGDSLSSDSTLRLSLNPHFLEACSHQLHALLTLPFSPVTSQASKRIPLR